MQAILEHAEFVEKGGEELLARHQFLGLQKVYGGLELFKKGSDACNSRQDIRRFDNHIDGWSAYDGLILNGYNCCCIYQSGRICSWGKPYKGHQIF
jgi:hypothetical protein